MHRASHDYMRKRTDMSHLYKKSPQRAHPRRLSLAIVIDCMHTYEQEHCLICYFDEYQKLLHARKTTSGMRDSVDISLRYLVCEALVFNAHSMLMTHNHPGGDTRPSPADIAQTRAIARALAPVQIAISDHIIIGRSDYFSFRENDLL